VSRRKKDHFCGSLYDPQGCSQEGCNFSPGSACLAIASIRSLRSGMPRMERMHMFQGHLNHGIYAVRFYPDGPLLASASSDCTAYLWNLNVIEFPCPDSIDLNDSDYITTTLSLLGNRHCHRSPSQTIEVRTVEPNKLLWMSSVDNDVSDDRFSRYGVSAFAYSICRVVNCTLRSNAQAKGLCIPSHSSDGRSRIRE